MFRLPRIVFLFFAAALAASLVAPQLATQAASTITINGANTHQVIDGFGASDSFRMASFIHGTPGFGSLTSAQTQQIMDMLFSTTSGAGLTIVRGNIGSSSTAGSTGVDDGDNVASIEPNSPGSPSGTPTYVWNTSDPHLDADQVWFAQTAKSYGVTQFFADAWSAPSYMKTNNALKNGGYLCGVPGQTCASGDWRQAYANYLVQYAKFYHQAGIDFSYIGYVNEPDFTPTSYSGMNFDATNNPGGDGTINTSTPQHIDFIKNYLGPTLAASGLSIKIACCDGSNWPNSHKYIDGIMADSGSAGYLALATGHGYDWGTGLDNVPFSSAANAGKKVWETEVSTFDNFNPAWDDGSLSSGFHWGQRLWDSLANGNVNGYLYWWFSENNAWNSDNEGLININGNTVTASKRLWAFGNYSRFVRPGAIRIDATTGDGNINVSAYRNTNGTITIVVLNGNSSDTPINISLSGLSVGSSATPYLTNANNNLAPQSAIAVSGSTFSATAPARSLITYVIGVGGATSTMTNISTMTRTPTRTFTPTATQPTFQPPTNTSTPTAVTSTPTPINTVTSTRTSTATNTPTSGASNTPTKTNTPTNTPSVGTATLKVQFQSGGTDSTQQSQFNFKVVNNGTSAQSNISVRIYIQLDNTQPISKYVIEKYWDQSGVASISGPTLASGSIYYYIINYGTTSLAAGGSWQFNTALHLSDWTNNFNAGNDFWHTGYTVGALPSAFTDSTNIPAYVGSSLIWGSTP